MAPNWGHSSFVVHKTEHDIAVMQCGSTPTMGGLLSIHSEFLPQMGSFDLMIHIFLSGRFLWDACIYSININLAVDVLEAMPRAAELT